MKPSIETHDGGVHRYRWDDLQLTASLQRVHRNIRGLIGQLTLEHDELGHLRHKDILLMSSSSAETYLRAIKRRVPELSKTIPFENILEYITTTAEREHEQSKLHRANLLVNMMQTKPTFCVFPFIQHGAINVMYGDPGSLKSYMALGLQAMIESGDGTLLDLAVEHQHKGLYLDWEWDENSHKHRLYRLLGPWPEKPVSQLADLRYIKCLGAIDTLAQDIAQIINDDKIGFVVVDSAVDACGADPNKDEAATMMRGILQAWGITSLLLAHPTKEGRGRGIRGSLMWRGIARNVWWIRQHTEAGEATAKIGLHHEKYSGIAPQAARGYQVTFDEEAETTCFERIDLGSVPELATDLSNKQRIIAVLKEEGPQTAGEIAEATGLTQTVCRTVLNRGKKQKVFVKLTEDKWALVFLGDETSA